MSHIRDLNGCLGMKKVTENRHEIWKGHVRSLSLTTPARELERFGDLGIDGGMLKWVILDSNVSVAIGFICLAINVLSEH
jgi:hypothetical protein